METINNINNNEIKAFEMMFPFNEHHHGNIHFATKNANGFKSMGYSDINSVLDKISSFKFHANADYYMTANTTRTGIRDTDNVFSYNNIVVDIDCHDNNIDAYTFNEALEEFEYRLQRDFYDTDIIPSHNILIRTGRGIQLWWCIDQIPSELGWLYNIAQKSLILAIKDLLKEYDILKCLEADEGTSMKKIGFYRMPLTVNSKTKTEVKTIINNDTRYDVNELTSYFWQIQKESTEETDTHTMPMYDKTFRALHHKRMDCIMSLAMQKQHENIIEGYRNNYAWLYYNACYQVYSEDRADEMLNELNAIFPCPLIEHQLTSIKRYIKHNGGLRMKQVTFFELLGEDADVKTRAMERKEKQIVKKNRNIRIKNLYKAGKTVKEIASETQVSVPTVLSVLNISEQKQDRNTQIRESRANGTSIQELAEQFKLSVRTINRVIADKVADNINKAEEKVAEIKEKAINLLNTKKEAEKTFKNLIAEKYGQMKKHTIKNSTEKADRLETNLYRRMTTGTDTTKNRNTNDEPLNSIIFERMLIT